MRQTMDEERLRILAVDYDAQDLRYVRDALTKPGYERAGTEASYVLVENARNPNYTLFKPHAEYRLLDLMQP